MAQVMPIVCLLLSFDKMASLLDTAFVYIKDEHKYTECIIDEAVCVVAVSDYCDFVETNEVAEFFEITSSAQMCESFRN